MKKFITKFSLLVVVIAVIGVCFIPLLKDTNYGLDLKGGFEVLYKVSPIEGDKVTSDMVTATYKIISRRIDALGVSEPDISLEGSDRIRVRLAGVTDETEARTILSKAASLSFRDSSDNLLMTSDVLKSGGVGVTTDDKGSPAVSLPIKDIDKFFSVTDKISKTSDKLIVIWLDFENGVDSFAKEQNNCGTNGSNCLSAATVSQAFASDVYISGNFTKEEATSLAGLINSGSLPTKLTELSSKSVTASFGENSLDKTLYASIIGFIIIFIMLIVIYRFSGFIAAVGLFIYTFLVFLIFWVFGGVLTLPGIASLILGIGMAVDANILSFERIKEELRAGHSLGESFKEGYKYSWSSIIDSNLTTLIAAIVLFIFGESSVKGFATMLIISIVITIIVMVFVVKKILNMFVKTRIFNDNAKLFINVKQKNVKKDTHIRKIDFLKYRKLFFSLSLIIFIVGTIFTFAYGLKLSVDFKGGTNFTITDKETLDMNDIQKDFKELGYGKTEISSIDNKTVYVVINNTLNKDSVSKVNTYFENKYQATVESGVVSTIVKQELVKNAIMALIIAIAGIILYVSFRFTFHFAISAIIALLHDVLFVIAMFSIFRLEINTIFIAAILTIIGYSINDTVVIFDRIREEKANNYKENIYNTINHSLSITMTRSLYTGASVIILVICLVFFGSHEILNFNLAMLFGLITGSYSSIFIASTLWYEMIKGKNHNIEKPKKVIKDKLEELTIKGINS